MNNCSCVIIRASITAIITRKFEYKIIHCSGPSGATKAGTKAVNRDSTVMYCTQIQTVQRENVATFMINNTPILMSNCRFSVFFYTGSYPSVVMII